MKKFGNSEFQQKAPFYYNLDVIISVGYYNSFYKYEGNHATTSP